MIRADKDSFNSEQIALIQETLDISVEGDKCIPKKILFESINDMVPLKMEQYQFELLLTQAIRSNKIHNYEIRQGRNGGVCRAGVFKSKDAARRKPISVTFNGKTFKVPNSKKKFLTSLLSEGAEGEDGKGNLFVNNRLYSVPESIDTLIFLEKYLNSGN